MILRYLSKLQPILNKVGKKHLIPVDEGKLILGSFFKSAFRSLTDPRLPKVMIPMFGSFMPKKTAVDNSIKASIRYYRKGGITREYLNAKIKRLWKIRQRLIKESEGQVTWSEWNSTKFKKEFEKLVSNEREEKIKSKIAIYGSDNNSEKSKRIFKEIQSGLRSQRSK